MLTRFRQLAFVCILCIAHGAALRAQHTPMQPVVPGEPSDAPLTRTRLYLRDGSFQIVLSYKVSGDVVRYRSAERAGAVEEVPLALVDLPRTERWQQDHSATPPDAASRAVLSPELAREEQQRAERTPFVATNLRLPEDLSVVVLDTFHDTPELVPLAQVGGDLNKQTAHNLLRKTLNPFASAHDILELKGERADVQLHVQDPVLYVRLETADDRDEASSGGGSFTVDTHGNSGIATPTGGSARSTYVLVRAQIRVGTRELESFRINQLGGVRRQADVIELNSATLPGGHWLRLAPALPLEQGEYALVEVVDNTTINVGVWDFGVHPTAPENVEAIHPEVPRRPSLDRRPHND